MTTQSIIGAQSFGTGSNVGNKMFSANPVTLADATTAYIINVQVTRPATPIGDKPITLRTFYTTTMRTVTAANAPATLGYTSRYVDITFNKPGESVSLAISVDSSLEVKTGPKLHVWCDVPGTLTACTLAVDVVECPS